MNQPERSSQIFKLPYDILLAIFRHHVRNLRRKIEPLDWLSFTHVCRTWRAAALESPSLWTRPDFRFPNIAREMLKRSRSLPIALDICTLAVAKREELAIEALTEHLPRIAFLELPFSGPVLERVLRVAVHPASSLHTLRLTNKYGGNNGSALRVALPHNFLGGASARLRRLSVKGLLIPWNSTFLKDLTHFDVELPSVSTPDLSLSQLVQILRRCPALGTLNMWNCLYTANEDIPPADLPQLRELRVSTKFPVLIKLMSSLKLHPSTELHLSVDAKGGGVPSPEDMTHLVSLSLRSIERNNRRKKIKALSFERLQNGSLTCTAWRNIPSKELKTSRPFFTLSFLVLPNAPPDLREYVDAVLQAAPISKLLTLDLIQVSMLPRTIQLLSTLTKLEVLDLSLPPSMHPCVTEFIGALGVRKRSDASHSQQRTPFPSLQTLHLHNVEFGSYSRAIALRSLFLKNLRSRRKRGVGNPKLVLTSCRGLSRRDIRKLRKLVPKVRRIYETSDD
ncbi:hypothetical protein V5O48_009307 [Marasmius crinis-equi]|uniref:F-box domain-containing protein n=1 Tax=Marasmius crinis-equi TaxID=585013 RepID=A0ABR3FBH6_9AGAR